MLQPPEIKGNPYVKPLNVLYVTELKKNPIPSVKSESLELAMHFHLITFYN